MEPNALHSSGALSTKRSRDEQYNNDHHPGKRRAYGDGDSSFAPQFNPSRGRGGYRPPVQRGAYRGGGYRGGGYRGGGRGGGGYRGRGGGGYRPRRPNGGPPPKQLSPSETIRALLVTVADKPAPEGTSMFDLLSMLCASLSKDLDEHSSLINSVLAEAITGFPNKVSVYGVIVVLLGLSNKSFTEEFVATLVSKLDTYLQRGFLVKFRLMVRFLGVLAVYHAVDAAVLGRMLAGLVGQAKAFKAESDAGNLDALYADKVFHAVASLAPWVAHAATPEQRTALKDAILAPLEDFAAANLTGNDSASPTLVRTWAIAQNAFTGADVAHDGAAPDHVLLQSFKQSLLEKKGDQLEAPLFQLPDEVTLPGNSNEVVDSSLLGRCKENTLDVVLDAVPTGFFRPEDAKTHDFTVFQVRQLTQEVLVTYHPLQKEAAKVLMTLVPDQTQGISHVVMETILLEMIKVRPMFPAAYFQGILVELCRTNPTTVPLIVEDTMDQVFKQLPGGVTVNAFILDRICEWFSVHLISFALKWPWSKWASVADKPEDAAERGFVMQIIQRVLRLSFFERVVGVLPPGLARIVVDDEATRTKSAYFEHKPRTAPKREDEKQEQDPATNEADNEPPAKAEDPKSLELGAACLAVIRSKCGLDGFKTWFEEHCGTMDDRARLELMCHAVMKIGAPSLTHITKAVDIVLPWLRDVCVSDDMKTSLMQIAYDYYGSASRRFEFLVQRFVVVGLLDVDVVVDWMLQGLGAGKRDPSSWATWEFLRELVLLPGAQQANREAELARSNKALEKLEARIAEVAPKPEKSDDGEGDQQEDEDPNAAVRDQLNSEAEPVRAKIKDLEREIDTGKETLTNMNDRVGKRLRDLEATGPARKRVEAMLLLLA